MIGDVYELVREGAGRYDWTTVVREHGGHRLTVNVFADAMKFDDVPELDWAGKQIGAPRYDGVRLPATPAQLQQIADHLDAMLLTPLIIEELWLQAKLQFNAVVNSGEPHFTIAAEMGITQLHRLIENHIVALGGQQPGQLVDSVGKYWCLINRLSVPTGLLYGDKTACNFGWCSREGSGLGVTPRVRCWQRPGFKHNLGQHDPSQTIRLMSKHASLTTPQGETTQVHLYEIARDPLLAPLIHHERGPLTCLRQPSVPEVPIGGTITMPELVITA